MRWTGYLVALVAVWVKKRLSVAREIQLTQEKDCQSPLKMNSYKRIKGVKSFVHTLLAVILAKVRTSSDWLLILLQDFKAEAFTATL